MPTCRSAHTAVAVLATAACVCIAAAQSEYRTTQAEAQARFDYLLHCSGCHLRDGAGAPPEVPSLRGMGRLVATPAGRAYIARVPEVAQAPLDDAALARLLNWVLQEFNATTLPAEFQPLDAAEVGAARKRVLADPLRTRETIVRRSSGS